MSRIIFMNDRLVPEAEAKVSVFDHGLLYGDGVFEGLRSYAGRVFRLDAHLDRLYDSARAICLEIPGANGQGESIEEAKQDLQAAIELLLEDREAEISRGLPPDAMRMPLQIG